MHEQAHPLIALEFQSLDFGAVHFGRPEQVVETTLMVFRAGTDSQRPSLMRSFLGKDDFPLSKDHMKSVSAKISLLFNAMDTPQAPER